MSTKFSIRLEKPITEIEAFQKMASVILFPALFSEISGGIRPQNCSSMKVICKIVFNPTEAKDKHHKNFEVSTHKGDFRSIKTNINKKLEKLQANPTKYKRISLRFDVIFYTRKK